MLSILVFTIHFAALYSISCVFSQSNSRSEKREKEKKPSDRIEGRKVWWKSPRDKSFFTFFGENIFLAKNLAPSINVGRAPYMVTSWGASFSWYESCYQRQIRTSNHGPKCSPNLSFFLVLRFGEPLNI